MSARNRPIFTSSRRVPQLLTGALLVAAATAASNVALAQSAGDKTAAEALFQEGKRLMTEGKYSEGCPKLAESNRLDPGAGTLTALALCHRGEGKTATAWSEFREVISLARKDGRKDREQVAQDNVNELEPKLSKLKITLDRATQQEGVEIKLDTTVIPLAMTGSALPVDPGVHKLTVSAAGYKPREMVVEIGGERDDKTVNITPLEKIPGGEPTGTGGVEATGAAGADAPADKGSGLRTASYIVGGLGIVGLGVGVVTGLVASGKHSDANCADNLCPDDAATQKEKDARSMANVSTVGFIAGGALLATGIVLNVLAPSRAKRTGMAVQMAPSVSPQGASWSVMGRF